MKNAVQTHGDADTELTAHDAYAVVVYVLAKNEEANIARCLDAIAASEWDAIVLDSGSTDRTREIALQYPRVSVVSYAYVDHCTTYNDITTRLGENYRVVLVLDADMVVSDALRSEVAANLAGAGTTWDALRAPIEMWVDHYPLRFGSLCPPKPFALVTGKALFTRTGHAERLMDGVGVLQLQNALQHDDRKPYSSFLQSQARYANKLVERYCAGKVSARDRLRIRTPLLAIAVPFVSFIVKRGLFSGQAGLLYALDRMIAELVMFRQGVAVRASDRQPQRRAPHQAPRD